MALTNLLPDFLIAPLDYLANMARKHSLWPVLSKAKRLASV